jgi:erythronate-4-phosphate dehydrogenase
VKIVADENIPLLEECFGGIGVIHALPGRSIDREAVRTASALLVRSVTPVNEALLSGSAVQFVGSATSGVDHVDLAYLQAAGIEFAHAPGANADSVIDYVLAAMVHLATITDLNFDGLTVGVVGVGQTGGRLARRAAKLGLNVLLNDPPRQRTESGPFVDLPVVLEHADIVSLHVPLTLSGPDRTRHLIAEDQLRQLKPNAWLINTSRGAVVDGQALLGRILRNPGTLTVLDVWEGEPSPDPTLIERVTIGTSHIAGYSVDGKRGGSIAVARALARFAGLEVKGMHLPPPVTLTAPDTTSPKNGLRWLHNVVRQMYDIAADDRRMRSLLTVSPSERVVKFERLRSDYPDRRDFRHFRLDRTGVPEKWRVAVEGGLCVTLYERDSS